MDPIRCFEPNGLIAGVAATGRGRTSLPKTVNGRVSLGSPTHFLDAGYQMISTRIVVGSS